MRSLSIRTVFRDEDPLVNRYLSDVAKCSTLKTDENGDDPSETDLFKDLKIFNPDRKPIEYLKKNLDEKAMKNYESIRDKIFHKNMGFVVSVAKQYQGQGVPLPDLINQGNEGMLKAIDRFDYTRGFKFISYAVRRIRQSILKHINENRFIQFPANRTIGNKINRFINIFQQRELRMPEPDEICDGCGISEEEYEQHLRVISNSRAQSFDKPFDDDNENTLYNIIGDESTPAPDHNITKKTEKSKITWALERLLEEKATYRQALACALRYGLNPKGVNPDKKEHTYEEISEIFKKEYDIDRNAMSIRVTIAHARDKLKEIITPYGEISEKYKREFEEKHAMELQISDIIGNTPKEKITLALNQLINRKGTETQAKVLSLRYGIHSKFNPDGKKYTVKEIAGQLKRREGSIKTTLDSAIKKFINILQNSPLQLEITNESGNNIPDSNIPESGSNVPGCDILDSKVYTEPRDSSDLNYRKEKVGQALKIFNNQKTKKEEDQYKAISLYSGLNKDGIAYSGKSFADKLERSYPQSASTTLNTAEKKVAKILGIDLSKMKEILENLNASNRSAISDVLSNTPEETITKQIDTSDVNYRRKQIIEALPKLKEKRLLGSKKGIDKIKYDKGEVLRLHSGINPDGSVGKAYNNKEISESLGITYTYTPKVLTAAKRDVADILGIKLDDLEKILKNLRKSNKADIKQVLEEPQSEVQDSPQNIDSFDPKEPQKKSPEAQNIPQSEISTNPQKDASIPTKITDTPDVIDLESKIKTALE